MNLAEKLATFEEHWAPRTVAAFNGRDVMVVKARGEFVWHHHDDTDDFFLVLKGRLTIRMRDGDVELGPGELFVVPAGVQRQPYSAYERKYCDRARGHPEHGRRSHRSKPGRCMSFVGGTTT